MIQSVVIDVREPDWVRNLNFGVPTSTAMLDAGDLWVATQDNALLVIERKTPSDLLASIADSRLLNQTAAMLQISRWCYTVITGQLLPTSGKVNNTGWNYNAVQGALLTVQEMGGHVIFAQGEDDFADCVRRLAKRSRGEIQVRPARETTIFAHGTNVLASLPGIGAERAMQLARTLPSTAFALQYLTDLAWDGEKITGIGAGIKGRVRQALGLRDGEKLALVNLDETELIQGTNHV